MYTIIYNQSQNRIYINIEGEMSAQESEKYINEMYQTINEASPGFTVFADLSLSADSVLENSGNFETVRRYASEHGVAGVVTLISPQAYEIHMKNPVQGARNIFSNREDAVNYLNSVLIK